MHSHDFIITTAVRVRSKIHRRDFYEWKGARKPQHRQPMCFVNANIFHITLLITCCSKAKCLIHIHRPTWTWHILHYHNINSYENTFHCDAWKRLSLIRTFQCQHLKLCFCKASENVRYYHMSEMTKITWLH